MKKYSKRYDLDDTDVEKLLSEQEREKRKELKEEWDKWVAEWKRLHEEDKMDRLRLREGEASDEEEEYEAREVEVEEVVSIQEEVLQD